MGQHMIFWYLSYMQKRLTLCPCRMRGLNVSLSLFLHPYFICESRKNLVRYAQTGLSLCCLTMLDSAISMDISFAGSSYHCDGFHILEKKIILHTTAPIRLHLQSLLEYGFITFLFLHWFVYMQSFLYW